MSPNPRRASVDEYLPGAVDGWTWAVDVITAAARDRLQAPCVAAATDVGTLVAEMHAALSVTATVATERDAARWRDGAFDTLETVCALGDFVGVTIARVRHDEIAGILDGLGALAGTPIIEGHGDLHVGQVLRTEHRFVVTDFDGNPILPAPQRMLPIPAVLDVAGMVQSLAHAAIVAGRYTQLEPAALADADGAGRAAFLDAYRRHLSGCGDANLYDPRPLRAFRVQQVLREIVYAARHLPAGCTFPTQPCPLFSTTGRTREAGWFRR